MNYYQVLDVPPDATPEDIKRAYRQLVRKHHPDVSDEQTGDRFHQIQAAYEILSDPGERRKYDLSVGWGRSPRTAIPYRPAARTQNSPAAAPQPSPPKPRPNGSSNGSSNGYGGAQSNAAAQRTSGTSARGSGTGSRSGSTSGSSTSNNGNKNGRSANGNSSSSYKSTSSGNQSSSAQQSSTGSSQAKNGFGTAAGRQREPIYYREQPSSDRSRQSVGDSSRTSSDKNASKGRTYSDPEATTDFGPRSTSRSRSTGSTTNTTQQNSRMRSAPADRASNGYSSNGQSSSRSTTSSSASQSSSTAHKPYSPPPRPEPTIPSFNKGVKSLKEALRSNRYSLATEIADVMAAHYSNRPLAMRLFVKAYHLRGNEMLYYKRYELAEIYLYEALKTAHSHYPELVKTIQSDLDRADTNRREIGLQE